MQNKIPRANIVIDDSIEILPYQQKFSADIFELTNKNAARLEMHFPSLINKTDSLPKTQVYIEEKIKNWNKHKEYAYLISFENNIIGHFNIKDINWTNNTAEFSYWIDIDYENKGIMTKIIKHKINYLFSQTTICKIVARCKVNNTASEKVMQKCGMQYEGTIHQNNFSSGLLSVDIYLYSIEKRNR